MSRYFSHSHTCFLESVGSPVVATPLTMSIWFWRFGSGNECFFTVGGYDGGNDHIFMLQQVNTEFRAYTVAGGSAAAAEASVECGNTSQWYHGCGVFRANNDRSVYLDGGNRGNNASAITPAVVTPAVRLGDRKNVADQPMTGRLAEAAVWNVALSDPEIAILGKGYSPLLIRPQNLVMYVPLIRDADEDIVGGLSFAEGATAPTIADHPRMFYIAPPALSLNASAVAASPYGPLIQVV